MRWLGLARARLQVRLAATAYNLRRTLGLARTATTSMAASVSHAQTPPKAWP